MTYQVPQRPTWTSIETPTVMNDYDYCREQLVTFNLASKTMTVTGIIVDETPSLLYIEQHEREWDVAHISPEVKQGQLLGVQYFQPTSIQTRSILKSEIEYVVFGHLVFLLTEDDMIG